MNGLIPFGIPLRMKKFSARLGRLGARNSFRPAPPRSGATPAGQFPSWEGLGVGWLAPGSWAGEIPVNTAPKRPQTIQGTPLPARAGRGNSVRRVEHPTVWAVVPDRSP